ncbi:hypothetical protein HPP92_010245 [Vanilla planifolia]|uniref:Pentatricopeptide repeat-containing protein n=1 Tax=Vanilla planifolia TaxID=51239 RepID=A0A835R3Q6_VANPL|nr:hypothetical protein HPP92_010245 [Vanilla planifolia]
MYSRCGDIETARKVFDLSNQMDLVNWNVMVAAYAHHGIAGEAISLFEEMQRRGLKPNDVTYIALLSACCHSGLVENGLKFFNQLLKDGSIELRDDHYACLIDLCSRAGQFEDAGKLVTELKVNNSSAFVWGALLGGCNFHGNAELGKLAAEMLLKADPCNAVAHLTLSKIYAAAGKLKEAANTRSAMTCRGFKKQPACSWIEIGKQVHVFTVQDRFHSHLESIHGLLFEIHNKMKLAVYEAPFCDALQKIIR